MSFQTCMIFLSSVEYKMKCLAECPSSSSLDSECKLGIRLSRRILLQQPLKVPLWWRSSF